MDVLDLDLALADGLRNEDVVQLLVLVVEDVRVALIRRHVREHVGLEEHVVERRENGAGFDELVEIARDDEVDVAVEVEDGLDERLLRVRISLMSV